MKENKTKNIAITSFLVVVIIILIYGLLNGFVGGVKAKENYQITLIERSIENQINENVEFVNRFDLNQSGYVFKSKDTYYILSNNNEVLDTVALKEINFNAYQSLSNENVNIYLAYFDQPVIVLENANFTDVYDLGFNNIFKYYK